MKLLRLLLIGLLAFAMSCSLDDDDDNPADGAGHESDTFIEITTNGSKKRTFKLKSFAQDSVSNTANLGFASAVVFDSEQQDKATLNLVDRTAPLSKKSYEIRSSNDHIGSNTAGAAIMLYYMENGSLIELEAVGGTVTLDGVDEKFCSGVFNATFKSKTSDLTIIPATGRFMITDND